jgi:chromosomal replication initiation ATPase DnaA
MRTEQGETIEGISYFSFPGIEVETDLQRLLRQVATITGVAAEQICDKIRTSDIAFARHIFCWYACENGYSHAEIAALIGRHRTAVAYAEKAIRGFIRIKDRRTLNTIKKLGENGENGENKGG